MVASDNGPGNLSADDRGALASCVERRTLDPRVVCNNERFVDKNANIGVLRLKRDVGKENSIGMTATSYNFIEKHNQVLAFDGRFRLDKQTTASFQVLGTTSRNFFSMLMKVRPGIEPETASLMTWTTTFQAEVGMGIAVDEASPGTTEADVGFVQRTNSNSDLVSSGITPIPIPRREIISYHIHTFNHVDYDWQGRMYAWESENLS